MTPQELETKIKKMEENGFEVENLKDEDLYALLAYCFWKDGMDWDEGVLDIASGQYLPFNIREAAIDQLENVFGYDGRED